MHSSNEEMQMAIRMVTVMLIEWVKYGFLYSENNIYNNFPHLTHSNPIHLIIYRSVRCAKFAPNNATLFRNGR